MSGDVRSSLLIFIPLYFLFLIFMCVPIATFSIHHFSHSPLFAPTSEQCSVVANRREAAQDVRNPGGLAVADSSPVLYFFRFLFFQLKYPVHIALGLGLGVR